MEMAPDEIVVRYRQAKSKGQQIKIIADLNACSVDDILQVLVKHGGYELQRISRAIGAARKCSSPAEQPKNENKIPYKKAEILPGAPAPAKKQKTIPPVVRRAIDCGFHYLADEIDTRRNRIEELEAEIEEFEKEIEALEAWREQNYD